MKSVKPGRGPSFIAVIMSIAMSVFGVFWTITATSMGAGPFSLFGVVFVLVGIAQLVYHLKNATGKNRYSSFDIVDSNEEPDPFNQYFVQNKKVDSPFISSVESGNFCPYCGSRAEPNFQFCKQCGKKLP